MFEPHAGYYRVNYDRHNWENIARCLDTDREKFHETNRAQIIDDAFNLARAGMVGYDLVFELLRSMKEEKSFIVWKAARRGFRYIQIMLARTGAFGDIQVSSNSRAYFDPSPTQPFFVFLALCKELS